MQRATIEQITALGSARRGGANEPGAAAERRGIFRLGGPLSGWFGARGQGWAFGGGPNYFGVWGSPPGNNRSTSS